VTSTMAPLTLSSLSPASSGGLDLFAMSMAVLSTPGPNNPETSVTPMDSTTRVPTSSTIDSLSMLFMSKSLKDAQPAFKDESKGIAVSTPKTPGDVAEVTPPSLAIEFPTSPPDPEVPVPTYEEAAKTVSGSADDSPTSNNNDEVDEPAKSTSNNNNDEASESQPQADDQEPSEAVPGGGFPGNDAPSPEVPESDDAPGSSNNNSDPSSAGDEAA